MKLKTVTIDGKTYAEVDGDKPVYESDDGKTISFDAPSTVSTITRLNGEAKTHRERAEKAETNLKAFEGLDATAAKDALAKLGNIDAKKLIDAGEVEKVKAEAIKAVEEKYAPVVAERDKLQGELHGEKIGGAFSRSKFITEKLAIPADLAQSRFEKNFKLEDGKVVAYDQSGNKLYSKSSPGNLADFDEAFEMLVDAYPYKDHILKGDNQQGGGAKNANGGTTGAKTMSRSQFDALPALAQNQKMAEGVEVVDA